MNKLIFIMMATILFSGNAMANAATPPPIISPSASDPGASSADSPDTNSTDNTENEEGEGWSDPDENGFWGSNDGTGGGEDDFQSFEENGE